MAWKDVQGKGGSSRLRLNDRQFHSFSLFECVSVCACNFTHSLLSVQAITERSCAYTIRDVRGKEVCFPMVHCRELASQ